MCLRLWGREGCQQQQSKLYLHSMWMHSSHTVPGEDFLCFTGSCSAQPWKEPRSGSRWNIAPWKQISASLGLSPSRNTPATTSCSRSCCSGTVKLILSVISSIHPQVYDWGKGRKGKIGIMEKEEKGFSFTGLLAYCEDKICTFYIRPLLAMHGAQRTKKTLITRS